MKHKIIGINNRDGVYRYIIQKDKDVHRNFCNLLFELHFDEDSINKVDIIFDDLENEFIYLNTKEIEIYFFITKKFINRVIKTKITQEQLNEVVKKYFCFPNRNSKGFK